MGFDCTQDASCAPGDHTMTWPCDYAPGTGRLAAPPPHVEERELARDCWTAIQAISILYGVEVPSWLVAAANHLDPTGLPR